MNNIVFHGHTQYQIGDYVNINIGYNGDGYITESYQIINIINTFPEITYQIKKGDQLINFKKDSFNEYTNIQHNMAYFRIGNIVSIKDSSKPTGFCDGTIIKKNIVNNKIIYVLKFIDNSEKEYCKEELYYPIGYFLK